MADRDKYGNYVNDKGVRIKINQDKNGVDHINFYDGPVDGDHSAVHVNVDTNNGKWSSTTHGEGHSNTEKGSGGCFLTTACMKKQTIEFDDNCHELQTLRWFRDQHVKQIDIDHYYSVAPKIVDIIDQLPNSDFIYKEIYDSVISVCVKAIENKEYELAYSTYMRAVKELENTYLN